MKTTGWTAARFSLYQIISERQADEYLHGHYDDARKTAEDLIGIANATGDRIREAVNYRDSALAWFGGGFLTEAYEDASMAIGLTEPFAVADETYEQAWPDEPLDPRREHAANMLAGLRVCNALIERGIWLNVEEDDAESMAEACARYIETDLLPQEGERLDQYAVNALPDVIEYHRHLGDLRPAQVMLGVKAALLTESRFVENSRHLGLFEADRLKKVGRSLGKITIAAHPFKSPLPTWRRMREAHCFRQTD